ncbi:MAG: glycosyltransferase [Thermoplasmata archaeon]
MLLAQIGLVIGIVAGVLLYWQFLGYPALMALLARRGSPTQAVPKQLPNVSVIVPTHNDASTIEDRIVNIYSQDYPKALLEVIVVESGSTDGTHQRAEGTKADHPDLIVLHQEEREGKASAINLGTSEARGDIVVVTDANALFVPTTLRALVTPFADAAVGGAGGRFVVRNADTKEASGTALFWEIERLLRSGEENLDSSVAMSGEVSAWRRGLVEASPSALAEDLDLAVRIRKQGYRVAYAPDAVVLENAPTRSQDMVTQWRRTSLGAIQCTFRHWRYLVRRPSWYSYFIYPSHKVLQILTPFLLIAGAIGLGLAIWAGGPLPVGIGLGVLLALSAISLLPILQGLRGSLPRSSGSLHRIPQWTRTFLSFQWSVLLAWKDYLTKRTDVRWSRVHASPP